MLQGTFETLSLPEVLGLLASSRKSGALWLEAGPIAGVVHLEDGHCHAAVAGELVAPVDDGPALLTRLVDLCFACMCQESGSFRFAADDPAPWWCPEPVELSDALVEVDRLLKQWREILRVIPSLECRPQLLETLEVDELVVDRERWALLVAIDGRRTVRELVVRAERPVMDVCHMLLELVDAGAIGVIDPAAAREPEPEVQPQVAEVQPEPVAEVPPEPEPEPEPAQLSVVPEMEPDPMPEPERPAEPHAAEVPTNGAHHEYSEAAAMSAYEPTAEISQQESSSEPTDKGAFLRLFSGLRES